MLPIEPTSVKKIIPSYLYLQYQDDENLPSLIEAYNVIAQRYLNWFNGINLPDYTKLSGPLLDWVGAGLYGLPRPTIESDVKLPITGSVATAPNTSVYKDDFVTTPLAPAASAQKQVITNYTITDDFYKRVLTWWFYKGDGFDWSVDWFKRRIYRFLNGVNGVDVPISYTPYVSVIFTPNTSPQQIVISVITSDTQTGEIFAAALRSGIINFPFRYVFTAFVGGVLTQFPVVNVSSNPTLQLDNILTPMDFSKLS